MYNINETILLTASIQGFLLFLGLITRRVKSKLSNVAIGIVIYVISIILLFSWGGATHYNNSQNAFPFWVFHSYLLIPVSFWIFFETNTNPKFRFSKKYLLLFLPAFLDIIVQIIFKFFYQLLEGQIFLRIIKSKIWFFFIEILPLFATLFILFFYVNRLYSLSKKFREHKSIIVGSYFKKMIFILVFLGLLLTSWVASTYYLIQYKIIEIVLVSLVFLLGYIAYFKPDFFEIPAEILLKNQNVFPNFDDQKSLQKLNEAFKVKSLYLRPKLTVGEVASELNLPSKYVTYLITNYHLRNFNDFVNGFRVEEVITRMSNPAEQHKSLLGIALDSGFNSKSSFNQVFKQHTGKTPSEYLL